MMRTGNGTGSGIASRTGRELPVPLLSTERRHAVNCLQCDSRSCNISFTQKVGVPLCALYFKDSTIRSIAAMSMPPVLLSHVMIRFDPGTISFE